MIHDNKQIDSRRCWAMNQLRLVLIAVVLVTGVTNVMIAELTIESSRAVPLRSALESFVVRSHNITATLSTRVIHENRTYAMPITSTPIHIPPNFIVNTKLGVHLEPALIQENILHNLQFFPEWKVISDNDDSCLRKIKQTPVFGDSLLIAHWFRKQSTPGMYKSDACRLAQLYLDGGVYLDNDLHITSSLLELLESGPEVISCINVGGKNIFQAILAAPPGHPLIRRSIEIMTSLIERQNFTKNIGPFSLRLAMNEVYNISSGTINRKTMLSKGALLLHEVALNSMHPIMKSRSAEGFCNIAITGITGKVYGFSRVKHWGSSDKMC
eukprot:CCRYP_008988-RA/>CCRYP_008988-RA protein AED:0.03 eAED:0.03 QI:206/1/1/1/0/0.5/2/296/326